MDLRERLAAAIAEDAKIHPVSGRPNRQHWQGIIDRHPVMSQPVGYPWPEHPCCEGCSMEEYDVLWPCAELRALAERLDIGTTES